MTKLLMAELIVLGLGAAAAFVSKKILEDIAILEDRTAIED